MGQCADWSNVLGLSAGEVLGRPRLTQDPEKAEQDPSECVCVLMLVHVLQQCSNGVG